MSQSTLPMQLQELISQPNINATVLQNLLSPAPVYLNNPTVMQHLTDIFNIITADRNNNQKFDLEDLKLLGTNMSAIISLVTAIVLLLFSLPSIKIEYKEQDTETFIYKILVYIFVVILPQKVNMQFTPEQMTQILTVCNMIYSFLIESGVLAKIIDKVATWVKKEVTVCWACIQNDVSALEKRMPGLKTDLKLALKK